MGSSSSTIRMDSQEIIPSISESQSIEHPSPVSCVSLSPDGSVVAACHDNIIKLWNTKNRLELITLSAHTDVVNFCTFSSDGSLLVTASSDATLNIWNSITGEDLFTLKGHESSVYSCSISEDKIVSASDDKTLKLWNRETGEELNTLKDHSDAVYCCCFSPDGTLVVSASQDQTLKVWNASEGSLIQTLKGHTKEVLACAVTPNSSYIVSASADFTLKIWDTKTWKEHITLRGHKEAVSFCAISANSSLILSSSWDKTLKLWNAATGKEICSMQDHTNKISTCALSQNLINGALVAVSASADKTVKFWDIQIGITDWLLSIDFTPKEASKYAKYFSKHHYNTLRDIYNAPLSETDLQKEIGINVLKHRHILFNSISSLVSVAAPSNLPEPLSIKLTKGIKPKTVPIQNKEKTTKEVEASDRFTADIEATSTAALSPHILLSDDDIVPTLEKSLIYAYESHGGYPETLYKIFCNYGDTIYSHLAATGTPLTRDEVVAIYLYTCEWQPKSKSLYLRLNVDLTTPERIHAHQWRFFLFYFFGGLRKIPVWKGGQDLYRGVNRNLPAEFPEKYKAGNEITWYSCTSTTTRMDAIKSFLPQNKPRTIFIINGVFSGRSIQFLSAMPNESEVLIPPASRFLIVSVWEVFVQIKQIPTMEEALRFEVQFDRGVM